MFNWGVPAKNLVLSSGLCIYILQYSQVSNIPARYAHVRMWAFLGSVSASACEFCLRLGGGTALW